MPSNEQRPNAVSLALKANPVVSRREADDLHEMTFTVSGTWMCGERRFTYAVVGATKALDPESDGEWVRQRFLALLASVEA